MAMWLVFIRITGFYKNGHKRKLIQVDDGLCSGSVTPEAKRSKSSSRVIDYSQPFAISNMLEALDGGKYGSVTKELQAIAEMRMDLVKKCIWLYPSLANTEFGGDESQTIELMELENQQAVEGVINLDDDDDTDVSKKALCVVPSSEIVILDSDDEDNESQRPKYQFQSSLVLHQKNQGDVTPVTPQFAFEEVDLGRVKEMPSAIKVMVVSSFFFSVKLSGSAFRLD